MNTTRLFHTFLSATKLVGICLPVSSSAKGLLCNVLPSTYTSWDHPDDLRKNIRTNQQTTQGTLFPGSANPILLFTAPESLIQRLQLLSTAEKPSSNNIFTAT